jgi:YidC/Oxa1 family membrane protein insertase
MDRNSVIGFLLIVVILGVYTWYTMPTEEERQRIEAELRAQAVADSMARATPGAADGGVGNSAIPVAESAVATIAATPAAADTLDPDSLQRMELQRRFGLFSPAAEGSEETFTLENDDLEIIFSSKGAWPRTMRLKKYKTFRQTPLLLSDPDSGLYGFRFYTGNKDIHTADLHFRAERTGAHAVRFTAPTEDPAKALVIDYALDSAGHFLHTSARFIGMAGDVDARSLLFHWRLTGRNNEKHLPNELQKCGLYFKYFNDDRDYLSETGAEQRKLQGRTNWVAFKQDFFTVAMVSDKGFAAGELAIDPLEGLAESGRSHTKRYEARLYFETDRGAELEVPMRFYLGPNHFGTLRRTGIPQFHRIIDLGWGIFGWMNRWLVIPIFNWLDGWGLSYGIIILVLTIIIKLLLMPLTWKNYVASARMRLLKPEMEVINAKFPKQDDALKKQQAVMDLYRKAGVNPASGCLPMIIQLPVLYAMFRFFPSSIELRQEKFLWADDLSSYDSILDLPFTIPMYGDHVSLFTLLMAASTIVYSLINQKQMPTQQGMPSMKLLIWLFPIMMLFFLNNFSAGLSYYYLLANVISILQMTALKGWFVDEAKIRAQLERNMATPKKKSRWQQRLEDLQKQQQAQRGQGRKGRR